MPATENCENCGRLIGKLETPWIHGENVVCLECWGRLKSSNDPMQIAQPPIATQPAAARVQTTEQTGKAWKLQMLLAAMLAIVGVVMLAVGFGGEDGPGAVSGLGCFALIAGLCWFVGARIGAWWFHG